MSSEDRTTHNPSASRINITGPPEKPSQQAQTLTTPQLKAVTDHVNPFCSAEEHDQVIRVLRHETHGSDEGLALADAWSRKGDNYPGADALASTWRSYSDSNDEPVTIDILRKMVEAHGFDWIDIYPSSEPDIETCEQSPITPTAPATLLDKYSLKGMREQLLRDAVKQEFALEPLALMGQATVIFGQPNIGKSLLLLYLSANAASLGPTDSVKLFYVNADDSQAGVLEKLEYADEFEFDVIAEGHQGFTADLLPKIMDDLIANKQAKDAIIILDTGKKFYDPMSKRGGRKFGKYVRLFVINGGTVIVLAHTNKYRDSDGKPIYAGTTDIVEDFDCAYLLYEVAVDADTATKTVQFENIKNRGRVARQVTYRYSVAEGLSYREILDSVEPVGDAEVSSLKQTVELKSDTGLIDVVTACIREGINTKMRLAEAAAEQSGASKRAVLRLIEKYSGSDPDTHLWNFQVHERGAKKYCLLTPDTTVTDHVVKP